MEKVPWPSGDAKFAKKSRAITLNRHRTIFLPFSPFSFPPFFSLCLFPPSFFPLFARTCRWKCPWCIICETRSQRQYSTSSEIASLEIITRRGRGKRYSRFTPNTRAKRCRELNLTLAENSNLFCSLSLLSRRASGVRDERGKGEREEKFLDRLVRGSGE